MDSFARAHGGKVSELFAQRRDEALRVSERLLSCSSAKKGGRSEQIERGGRPAHSNRVEFPLVNRILPSSSCS